MAAESPSLAAAWRIDLINSAHATMSKPTTDMT